MMSSTHLEQKTEIETLYVEESDLTFFVPKDFTGVVVYSDPKWPNVEKHWYLNGRHHRENGPAIEGWDDSKWWYLNGRRHKEDGPAVEMANGLRSWFLNDEYLFGLPLEFQPFVFLEEFVDEEDNERIKVLTQEGIRIWPNLPGLKECAENWDAIKR